MNITEVLLHLSLIKQITPRGLFELIGNKTPEQILQMYEYFESDFVALGLNQELAQALVLGLADTSMLEKELELMQKHSVGVVTIFDAEYPDLLKNIHVPPVLLYYQGDVGLFKNQKTLACVGSRKASVYVQEVVQKLIVPMIHDGWVVVSGGALGADTYAHQAAVQNQAKTIAVMGAGLSWYYPASNKKLFNQIIQFQGLLVSPFSMATPPEPWCFPQRNRIISGLSQACLVLQAAAKSGALITAEYTLDQGREVFAIPGSIFDPLSAGCHGLIAQGAKLIQSVQDLQEGLGCEILDQDTVVATTNQLNFVLNDSNDQQNNETINVLKFLASPLTADSLLSKMKISTTELQQILFDLSLDGKVEQDAMGFWKRLS